MHFWNYRRMDNQPRWAEAGFQLLSGFRGLFGVGCVAEVHDHDGYDLVSFETDRNENQNAPIDYRGWSGGALWRVYITQGTDGQPTAIERRIFGVAPRKTIR
jgi:hypothetical protein